MTGGPRRRRGRLWAGLYAAAFGPGDDAPADGPDRDGDSDGDGAVHETAGEDTAE